MKWHKICACGHNADDHEEFYCMVGDCNCADLKVVDKIPAVRPMGRRALLQRLELPDQTESGLYILGREFPMLARVVRLGPGWRCGFRRDRVNFRLSGNRWCVWRNGRAIELGDYVPIDEFKPGDQVHWSNREHWQIYALPGAPEWAIFPVDELDCVRAEEVEEVE